jgi:hypothetical protein
MHQMTAAAMIPAFWVCPGRRVKQITRLMFANALTPCAHAALLVSMVKDWNAVIWDISSERIGRRIESYRLPPERKSRFDVDSIRSWSTVRGLDAR